MNIKVRFALLFSSFVAILSTVSLYTIYFLYSNYREEDYYTRLENEGTAYLNEFVKKHQSDSIYVQVFNDLHHNLLYKEQIAIISGNGKIIAQHSKTLPVNQSQDLIQQIITNKSFRYKEGLRECLGVYDPESKLIFLVSALDKYGLAKTRNLRIILSGVFIGSLVLTGLFSFLFVQEAFKPLMKLSQQMQKTNENNLTERIEEGEGKDEIQQIAKNFNAMLERLNSAFEGQKKFVQHASHELRTPLANMLSVTESALNKPPTYENYQKTLHSLKDEQENLIELTNALLMLSQNENISYSNEWPMHRVDEILYDSISEMLKVFPDANITMDFENLPQFDDELYVQCNDTLLRSAFRNLIKNGYLYSSNKTVNILISINNSQLIIAFTNLGTQIKNSELPTIMKPFYRGFNARNKKGFGLGLSIVSGIIKMHKGIFTYETEGAEVNKFKVILNNQHT